MLYVKTPEQVLAMIQSEFSPLNEEERVPLRQALGRTLAEDIEAREYVPDFDRSTVDGYAVRAGDTFGCTDAIPAILPVQAAVLMGEGADFTLNPGECAAVPTGGAVPAGADSGVMMEYTGRVLSDADIGALAAIGCVRVPVAKRLTVGVISTGDELVPPEMQPGPGQVRDVNSPMLEAMLKAFGCQVINYGIVADDEALLAEKVEQALADCHGVLLSGGSSVGVKDAACRIIQSAGELLLHGIAIKPGKPAILGCRGKPTILGKAGGKPIVGLPGHPVAAYFITRLFVMPLLGRLTGREQAAYTVTAKVTESISANHGRAQYHCCRLIRKDTQLLAQPIRGKSGLITTLAGADGYFCISRDCEGIPQGAEIQVTILSGV